jgi:nitrogen fixation/metabolism regulation signal transduction histidine kinase
MRERAEKVTGTLGMLRALESERAAVVRGYVLPFVLAYVVLLAAAAILGMVLARRIARPVEELARAARRVGTGDLTTRVKVPASGEVGALVDSFNAMVEDLATSHEERARLERLAAWRDLARKLAHEIKNPLTPIQLAVHQATDRVAARGGEDAGVARECREIVDEEVDRLRKLVRTFSEFARLPTPEFADGDLAALLADVQRLYGEERVALAANETPLGARFDAAEMRRVLVNLIDNGLASCREAGVPERITLRAAVAGGVARLEVADRGPGIAPENLSRIFEPSFTTKKDGMGLGLAIVDGIVRAHGGAIRAESAPDSGAVFVITWPAGGAA